jgi:diguanylate cyclase (GGDEF)-like protein
MTPSRLPGAPPSPDETPWNPSLVETLYELMYRADAGWGALEADLRRLEEKSGNAVYAELIYLLSHLRFAPDEARACWDQIVAHRQTMQEHMETPVDLRVALVSYFLEINRRLQSPKVIELKLFEQTRASAYRDDLTGLWNYRYFREYLAREVHRCRRNSPPMSLVMIDLDDFKQHNDAHGHEAGSQALGVVARILNESLRQVDVAARYGGEEFALVLPATTKTGAHQVAERIRERIERHLFPLEDGRPGALLTASIGVATCPADARDPGGMVRCADAALYVAKSRGKNQVHLYGQNRRSYRRIDATLAGRFCLLAAESHPLTTLNLSEGGLLFLADRSLPVGSLIDIGVTLPGGRAIASSGRVIRVEDRGAGKYEAAVRIIEMPARDQGLLTEYLKTLGPTGDASEPGSDAAEEENGPAGHGADRIAVGDDE